ncbi:hypothetical protein [Georgenia sp. SUBG003]|uniref:hypothetical protein n=1 Tax=Georgenia sp. SUBG003 TaxID=1497974 RepID=UPI003AB8AB08
MSRTAARAQASGAVRVGGQSGAVAAHGAGGHDVHGGKRPRGQGSSAARPRDVRSAWDETFARAGIGGDAASSRQEDGVPGQLLELAARQAERDRLPRVLRPVVRRAPGLGPTTAGALPGTIAACRLTHELGAPLAEVLQRCAEGLTEAGHARAARAVALAGPRATARLLGWLPLLGLVLGAGIGADPVGVLCRTDDGGRGRPPPRPGPAPRRRHPGRGGPAARGGRAAAPGGRGGQTDRRRPARRGAGGGHPARRRRC